MRILLVEDDLRLGCQIRNLLCDAGHSVEWKRHGNDLPEQNTGKLYDIIIMDVTLPHRSGFQVVEAMRALGVSTPVLFLSARGAVIDKVQGLKCGGDDYLTKPFASEELIARLDALQRRSMSFVSGMQFVGEWSLDSVKRRLVAGEKSIDLQPREWALLKIFIQHQQTILTKTFLLEKVWDIRFDPGTNVVDAMICRLRRKLENLGVLSHITTIRGKGYVFDASA